MESNDGAQLDLGSIHAEQLALLICTLFELGQGSVHADETGVEFWNALGRPKGLFASAANAVGRIALGRPEADEARRSLQDLAAVHG